MFKPSSNVPFAGKLPGLEETTNRTNHGKPLERFPLSQLAVGKQGRVHEITFALAARLQQLSSFGLAPGCEFRVRQRHPAVVIEIGHTTLALDFEVANEILVESI